MLQNNQSTYIFDLLDIDTTMISLAGGKGANLGELSRIEGISVPEGFCITTDAFKEIIAAAPSIQALLNQLSLLKPEDGNQIAIISSSLRRAIGDISIPAGITEAINAHLSRFDAHTSWAIRSSATAEDLPVASFAGQQDTYLNIIGRESILKHISMCWASLFTERAVVYRSQNGFGHDQVFVAVVVQKMVFPQAAGILFTADPVTGNRKISAIDAGFGLGEALVSGIVSADNYRIYNGTLADKKIADKKKAIHVLKEGGTEEQELDAAYRYKQVLTDKQALQLEQTGRKIEAHFGHPQDIEWCLAEDTFYMVQSRPVTTLYPVPETNHKNNRVYLSVGHQQMMTDPIKPLGLSIWQLTASAPMHTAGGRLFVDITDQLASPVESKMMMDVVGKSDPLIEDALLNLMERGDFIQPSAENSGEQHPGKRKRGRSFAAFQTQIDYDPSIIPELIQSSEEAVETLRQDISTRSGRELFDFIEEDIQRLKQKTADPRSFAVFMTAMNAAAWLNEKMEEWLGETNAADILAQSVPDNITSEMGLALLDVADVIRPYPQVIEFLRQVRGDDFMDHMEPLHDGPLAREAIVAFLRLYGMRCTGEIDITRPRWSEQPSVLVPMILNNIKNFEQGSGRIRFEKGLGEALKKEQELEERLLSLPDGVHKSSETKKMISRLRNFIGYREYPKYHIVSRYLIYKQALLKEAEQLVHMGAIPEKGAVYYLSFEELREAVSSRLVDQELISERKTAYQAYKKLKPPRVLTSDGEIITGRYKRDKLPEGALVGLPVSSGIVEGRARVILKMEEASLELGDILVTVFTDPSWTPLFVSAKGLVTEVGGLMTHGAVIAREYGLPAVVGIENATRLIRDGQRIRVDGTKGYVEII